MPQQLITKFAQVFIHYFSNKSRSTTKLFISEPSKSLEQKMGRLFGIIEINTPSRENGKIINQLIAELEETYYAYADKDISYDDAFEKTLRQVNNDFVNIITENTSSMVGNLNEYTMREKINLAIGVLHKKNITLTSLNTVGAFLLHKSQQDYKIIPIVNDEDTKQPEKVQLFNNVISGQAQPGDYIFISNNDFLNFVSKERITKTVTSLPPQKAADYFKHSLLSHEGFNFAAIIIQLEALDTEQHNHPLSLSTIDQLNKKESQTERLLSPSIIPNLQNIKNSIVQAFQFRSPSKDKTEEDVENDTDTLEEATEETVENTQDENNFSHNHSVTRKKLNKNLHAFKSSIFDTAHNLQSRMRLKQKLNTLRTFIKLKYNQFALKVNKIPAASKILISLVIVGGALFFYSIQFLEPENFKFGQEDTIPESLTSIESTLDEAESKLIFGDDEQARSLLSQAEMDLSSVTIDSSSEQEFVRNLSQRFDSLIAKLRNITLVDDPTLLHTEPAQGQTVPSFKSIVSIDDTLYLFDTANNTITSVNTRTRESQKIQGTLDGTIVSANQREDSLLLVTDTNAFYEIENNLIKEVPVLLTADEFVTDFTFYNDRLYNLIPSRNQIYRHPQNTNGYGSGITWIQESGISLENAHSIGIDTRIWVATDTQIMKFFKGSRQAFSIQNLEPELTKIDSMIKPTESNYIYILENANNRVIVVDDEGTVITQYFSPSLDQVTAFQVDENGNALYLANNNEIYAIIMSHL